MSNFYSSNATIKALTTSLCFALIFIQNVNAQSPVLTADNFALRLGDKFVFINCKTDKFDTSGSGINQVWDYSYLKDTMIFGAKIIDTQICVLPSTTMAADSFPDATIATTHSIQTGVTPYNDYWSDDSGYYYWGYYLGTTYRIHKKAYATTPLYPISYNSSYIDSNSYTEFSLVNPLPNDIPYTYHGADTLIVDGYGTLMLPDTIINKVLRLKAITSFSTNTLLGVYTRRIEYYYFLTPNYHANILTLQHYTYFLNGIIIPGTESKIIIRASNTGPALPLQIVSFNAYLKGQNVLLQWQTANEINTNYFNIQRSNDGIHFNAINKVVAAGNSSSIKNYSYSDAEVTELNVSKLYYRLQEVDKDGKSNYSRTQLIDFTNTHSLFSVSPNPSKDFINITSTYNVSAAQVKITDISGKTLFTSRQDFVAGQQMKISLFQFPSEVLIVTIKSTNSNEQFKIVKE